MTLRKGTISGGVLMLSSIFLLLMLNSCSSTGTASVTRVRSSSARSVSVLVTPCTPDAVTGICYPSDASGDEPFDHDAFIQLAREHQRRSSSSARYGRRSSEDLTSSADGSDRIPGRRSSSSSSSSAFSFTNSQGVTYVSDGDGIRDVNAPGSFRQSGNDDIGDSAVTRSADCPRNRSLLGIVPDDMITSGRVGQTFPVLISGDCPITAGILKVGGENAFGGPLDF